MTCDEVCKFSICCTTQCVAIFSKIVTRERETQTLLAEHQTGHTVTQVVRTGQVYTLSHTRNMCINRRAIRRFFFVVSMKSFDAIYSV